VPQWTDRRKDGRICPDNMAPLKLRPYGAIEIRLLLLLLLLITANMNVAVP